MKTFLSIKNYVQKVFVVEWGELVVINTKYIYNTREKNNEFDRKNHYEDDKKSVRGILGCVRFYGFAYNSIYHFMFIVNHQRQQQLNENECMPQYYRFVFCLDLYLWWVCTSVQVYMGLSTKPMKRTL